MKKTLFSLGSFALLLLASSAHAQITYDNLGPGSSLTGSALLGGATAAGTRGLIRTGYILDRLMTLNPGAPLGEISFSVVNTGATSVDAGFTIAIYDTDGVGGAPGTQLNRSAGLGPTGGVVRTYAPGETIITPYPLSVNIPASGELWIGLHFDNLDRVQNTFTSATATELNQLGLGTYNTPTIGSSGDNFFHHTSGATPGFLLLSNPAGSITNLGGSPVANIGWRLSLAASGSAPEPSSLALGALGLLTVGVVRRRLKTA